jgi:hypothetical protein
MGRPYIGLPVRMIAHKPMNRGRGATGSLPVLAGFCEKRGTQCDLSRMRWWQWGRAPAPTEIYFVKRGGGKPRPLLRSIS